MPGRMQVSFTDQNAGSMATITRKSALIGYKVEAAVDSKHHLTVVYEVANEDHYRAQL